MLADKIKYICDKFVVLMPSSDAQIFRNIMYGYVTALQNGNTNLQLPQTNNPQMNQLIGAIITDLSNERMNPNLGSAKKVVGYRYPRYYWYNPWWWNYWYYYWSPYYWWRWDPNPYDGITYIGGSKKVGQSQDGLLNNVLDSVVDVHSMNLECDENRVCNFRARFTKAQMIPNGSIDYEDDE